MIKSARASKAATHSNMLRFLSFLAFKQIFVLFVLPKRQIFEIQAQCGDCQVFTSSINDASIFWNFENPTRCQNNLKSRRYILICNLNLGQALKQTCLVVYVWLILKSCEIIHTANITPKLLENLC